MFCKTGRFQKVYGSVINVFSANLNCNGSINHIVGLDIQAAAAITVAQVTHQTIGEAFGF